MPIMPQIDVTSMPEWAKIAIAVIQLGFVVVMFAGAYRLLKRSRGGNGK